VELCFIFRVMMKVST